MFDIHDKPLQLSSITVSVVNVFPFFHIVSLHLTHVSCRQLANHKVFLELKYSDYLHVM